MRPQGGVQRGEDAAAATEEAVEAAGVAVFPDNLACIVDAKCNGSSGGGGGGIRNVVKVPALLRRKPWVLTLASVKDPTIWAALLMPRATVPPGVPGPADGSSIGMKVPPLRRKPWVVLASLKNPTIWPASLMPKA
jgi:hypothetical protein